MHFHPRQLLVLCALVAVVTEGMAGPARDAALGDLAAGALEEMEAERWAEARSLLLDAAKRFDQGEALREFGPQFGVIHYRKGLCEMKLGLWEEAMASFETCYRDFPDDVRGRNPFHKMALLKHGEAAMGAGEWRLALRQFKKFTEERDPRRDDYARGAFYINLAVCHYRLGNIPQGNGSLEIAIKNKAVFSTPLSGILSALEELVSAARSAEDQQGLLDFLVKNREGMNFGALETSGYSGLLVKLATDASGAGMGDAALELYRLVPGRREISDDIRSQLEALAGGPEEDETRAGLERRLAVLDEEAGGAHSPEIIRLRTLALIEEIRGNLQAALRAYEELEAGHPHAAGREDSLYQLIRIGFVVSEDSGALVAAARRFLDLFPGAEHALAVRQMLLALHYQRGEHAACVELASSMIGHLEKGTNAHDLCLHVSGVARYHLGEFEPAAAFLDEHVAAYPGSRYIIAARYFQASCRVHLGRAEEAAELLDAFLKDWPDPAENEYLPYALYDRALIHRAQGGEEAAAALLERIGKEFPDSPVAGLIPARE